jgi:general secretion pathway protein M
MLRSGSLLSRSLALVLMLGAAFTIYNFALLPLLAAHRGARTTIEQTTALLRRYQALAEQRTRLADQVSDYARIVAEANSFLPGQNDVIAAAALQERAKSVIERAHGELRSTQLLPAHTVETAPPVRLIALKIHFIIDINYLRAVLYALETGNPYLFIDELRIQQHEAPDSDSALDVTITIEGYTSGGARTDTLPHSRSATLRERES